MFGVSERMISLTIVALGTSLPELVTSISATRKGQYEKCSFSIVAYYERIKSRLIISSYC